MEVKCIITDYLAEKLSKMGEVKLESVFAHGDKVRLTSSNGVSCVVNADELIAAAKRCKLDGIGGKD